MATLISLAKVKITQAAYAAWQNACVFACMGGVLGNVAPEEIEDEQAEIHEDGTLVVFASVRGRRVLSMPIPQDEWSLVEGPKPSLN